MGNTASKRQTKENNLDLVPEASLAGDVTKVSQRKSGKGHKKKVDNAKLVEEYWCNAFNRHEMKPILKFCAPSCQCWFVGADKGMSMDEFVGALALLSESFPDNRMRWDSIEEISPGVVRVQNFVGYATHTGKPYSFGPYPPIPATGIVVEEDPCHLMITVKKGKMVKFVIDAYHGNLVGPPGYYQKIGGKLEA